ncbi:soma ferritin-like [Daphnia pulex]|uniref:Ferritin n=1 Tax=Daphnia pulex TaxID=6669 RepID=A1C330_DAPPU|nr:soma ferritin-like [Daphnia pulex]XP_046631317.1 soma ferritin-like [Daphnia pulicaria]ABK91576.1 ferritin 3-like protein [Daphnia pulex]ABK91579.1 ferritin 3-like protein C [Daphnia pulex]
MVGKGRHNFHEESEASINKQINIELNAHYQYLALAAYYDRDDVALKGFAKFYKESADEENEHAQMFMKYQNIRGGRVVLTSINRPAQQEWASPLVAMEFALNLEKQVNQSLLDLHKVAGIHSDPHLSNYLEEHFLEEQVQSINKLAKHHTNLLRVGDGLGIFMYDKELQS